MAGVLVGCGEFPEVGRREDEGRKPAPAPQVAPQEESAPKTPASPEDKAGSERAAPKRAEVPAAAVPAVVELPPVDFFVSPMGDDRWTGRLAAPNEGRTDGPFATLGRARDAVRDRRKAAADQPATVVLRGGTYFLGETLAFGAEDSGTVKGPVVYMAYPGEVPVLSGGSRITDWKVVGGKWQAALPEVAIGKWAFAQLFVGGERRFRPRLPKEGFYFIRGRVPRPMGKDGKEQADDAFRFRAGDIREDWRNLGDVEVMAFHPWFTSILRIRAIEDNVVRFTGPTRSAMYFGQLSGGMRYLVDNVAEALTEPGQWYLDRGKGMLTYIPKAGEAPEASEVIAPRLERLVALEGASHIEFRGLVFSHSNTVIPPEGSSMVQAATRIPGALWAEGASHCALRGCVFRQLGTYGAEFGARCADNVIEGCRFEDLGAGGVKIGTERRPAKEEENALRNVVRDNLIAHGGRLHAGAVGVWVGHAAHSVVEHNHIYDLYYTGISVGWSWGYGPSGAHDNRIEWNHIHDIGQTVLSDMGGIYTLGLSPGTVLRFNRVHDVSRYSYGGWGLYPDEGTSDMLMEKNLVYRTQDGGFHQHYGEANIFRNNIIANAGAGAFYAAKLNKPKTAPTLQDRHAFRFEKNIVFGWEGTSVVERNWGPFKDRAGSDFFQLEKNLYWNGGKAPTFLDKDLAGWQAQGFDRGSVVADPKFCAPGEGDFTLAKDSPALALGFEPFDVSGAGRIEGHREAADMDPARWPRCYPPAPAPQPIADGFEETPVGSVPDMASVKEDGDKGTVRVTDKRAATGKRSLIFADAAGVNPSWAPHAYWRPAIDAVAHRGRWSLFHEPGAVLYYEWRTDGSPYKVGPSISIDAKGGVQIRNGPMTEIPARAWVEFVILWRKGEKPGGEWDLEIRPAGRKAKRFERLGCDAGFDRLRWVGFSSTATGAAEFFVDDVEVAPMSP